MFYFFFIYIFFGDESCMISATSSTATRSGHRRTENKSNSYAVVCRVRASHLSVGDVYTVLMMIMMSCVHVCTRENLIGACRRIERALYRLFVKGHPNESSVADSPRRKEDADKRLMASEMSQ